MDYVFRTFLLITFTGFLFYGSTHAQNDSVYCSELYRKIHQQKYQEVIQSLSGDADCECYDSYRHKGGSPKFWFPGWLFATIVHSLSDGTLIEYSLTTKTLEQPQSAARDSLLEFLVLNNPKYNDSEAGNYLGMYISIDSARSNPKLFELMYNKASYHRRLRSCYYAFSKNHTPFIDRFLPEANWKKDGMWMLLQMFEHDTIPLIDEVFTKQLTSPNKQYFSYLDGTFLHELIDDLGYGHLRDYKTEDFLLLLEVLKKHQVDLEIENQWGYTVMDKAIKKSNLTLFDWLLDNGIDIHRKNSSNRTYLFRAVEEEHYYMVKTLLEKGVDPSVVDKDGKKAADLVEFCQTKILELLGAEYDTVLYNSQYLLGMMHKKNPSVEEKEKIHHIVSNGLYTDEVVVDVYEPSSYQVKRQISEELKKSTNYYLRQEFILLDPDKYEKYLEHLAIQSFNEALKEKNYSRIGDMVLTSQKYADLLIDKIKRKIRYIHQVGGLYQHSKDFYTLLSILNEYHYIPYQLPNKKWGFANKNGIQTSKEEYDFLTPFGDQAFSFVKRKEKWGVLDLELRQIVPCKFDSLNYIATYKIHSTPHFLFQGKINDSTTVLDLEYRWDYKTVTDVKLFPGEELAGIIVDTDKILLQVSKQDKVGLYETKQETLKVIYASDLDEIKFLPQRIDAVRKGDKWSLQPRSEAHRLKFKWHEYTVEDDKSIRVRKGKKWKNFEF